MTDYPTFTPFPKIPRLSREVIITEKIDGTNGVLHITDDRRLVVGSRTRWLTDGQDNFGFARWAFEHKDELLKLGPGTHYGEWWGNGIQRGYGLKEKRFSLFNVSRWGDPAVRPSCCGVVPVLMRGPFDNLNGMVELCMTTLNMHGSSAAPGWMRPEGIIVFHTAGNLMFKKTLEKDNEHKGESK